MIPKPNPCNCCQYDAGNLIRFTKKDDSDEKDFFDFLCDDCIRCIYDVVIEPGRKTYENEFHTILKIR